MMKDNNIQPKNNNDLIERQKKWKRTERITLAIDLVLLLFMIVLSVVQQLTDFSSIAFFILAVIFCVFMLTDLVLLFVSWCKLYRINWLIAEQENNNTDNDDDI
ncbi:MAG: hypothetical protein ACI4MQ_06555 [Candidatus Coproplasma sp.]